MLGETVRRLRLQKGWTQVELADHAGISRQSLNNIERGRSGAAPKTLLKLATTLGVTVEELMGVDAPKEDASVALRKLDEDDRRVLYGMIAIEPKWRSAAMYRHDMREFARLKRALRDLGHGDFDLAKYIQDSEAGEELRRELNLRPLEMPSVETSEELVRQD